MGRYRIKEFPSVLPSKFYEQTLINSKQLNITTVEVPDT